MPSWILRADVNNTGLMWESAPAYGALMVFAEHRYFGQSLPFGASTAEHMQYLSAEQVTCIHGVHSRLTAHTQALADYATLVYFLRDGIPNGYNVPFIGTATPHHALHIKYIIMAAFGGSYGGMLASWFRIKYPNAVDGAIAGSAPIVNFMGQNYSAGRCARILCGEMS